MPKFMMTASYTADGVKGMIKDGGTGRRAIVQQMVESVGGTLETFYFAYGQPDAYAIVDLPDASSGLAISLSANASGAVRLTTIPLITAEEFDVASKKATPYRAPGS
jgi:uncharacterized protein with GYD domain